MNMETDTIRKCSEILGEEAPGIVSTGYPALDASLGGGWKNETLNVIASRPAMGKTSLALDFSVKIARKGVPVLYFSLEMSGAQLCRRLIKRTIGGMRDYHFNLPDGAESAVKELSELPLYIDDTPGLSIEDCEEKVKKVVEEKEIGIIFIDYLQLMKGREDLRNFRTYEVDDIVRSLKALAREVNVPIVVLSQLSKAISRSAHVRPQLYDLRETSELEPASDTILLIGEDRMFLDKSEEGGGAEFDAVFDLVRCSFVDINQAVCPNDESKA